MPPPPGRARARPALVRVHLPYFSTLDSSNRWHRPCDGGAHDALPAPGIPDPHVHNGTSASGADLYQVTCDGVQVKAGHGTVKSFDERAATAGVLRGARIQVRRRREPIRGDRCRREAAAERVF